VSKDVSADEGEILYSMSEYSKACALLSIAEKTQGVQQLRYGRLIAPVGVTWKRSGQRVSSL
jgi:hypothetical protein